jgi:hypothetical protein
MGVGALCLTKEALEAVAPPARFHMPLARSPPPKPSPLEGEGFGRAHRCTGPVVPAVTSLWPL